MRGSGSRLPVSAAARPQTCHGSNWSRWTVTPAMLLHPRFSRLRRESQLLEEEDPAEVEISKTIT